MIALSIVLIFLLIYFCQFQSSKTSFDRDKQKILFMVTGNMGCQLSKDWIKKLKNFFKKISFEDIFLGAHVLLWTFFDNFNF